MKIDHIVGTRPQFVKLAPVLAAMHEANCGESFILNSGQHYDQALSTVFFEQFGASIDLDLNVRGTTHAEQTGRMMEAFERHWLDARPDIVLVYGDTNTTLAAALAAVKLDLRVFHVEAGLRAEIVAEMMPEEINRAVVDRISSYLYTPTNSAAENLRREGYRPEQIVEVGDVMYDIVLATAATATADIPVPERFALATWHRAENTDDPVKLAAIADAFATFSREHYPIVLPLHPRTRKALEDAGRLAAMAESVRVIDPIGHAPMLALMKACAFVISDSGGVPKEAAFLKKRSVILRRDAVWIELIKQEWADIVVPDSADAIVAGLRAVAQAALPAKPVIGFGDGDAAAKIARHIKSLPGA